MTTLAEAMLGTARACGGTYQGVATGGSTTTLVDSANSEPDNYFLGGCIWFLSGNNAGKSAQITGWDDGTHTFTFATQSGACAAGDRYAAVSVDYPRWLLMQAVNQALQEIGEIPTNNDTVTTVAGQQEYTLPAGVARVCRLEIANASAAPYDFTIHMHWKERNGKLYITPGWEMAETGRVMRLWYNAAHAELTADADVVNGALPLELVRWKAAEYALRHRLRHTADNKDAAAAIADAIEQAARSQGKYLGWVQRMAPDAMMGGW